MSAPPSRSAARRTFATSSSLKLKAARTTRSVADRPAVDELLQLRGLRVVAVHERLHENPARAVGGVEGALDLLGPPVERLLAEDVLAGLERAHRPLDVKRVRQRDVDRLDVGVREQRLVAPVGALDPVLARVRLGARLVAARDARRRRPRSDSRAPARTSRLMCAVEMIPHFVLIVSSKGRSAGYSAR